MTEKNKTFMLIIAILLVGVVFIFIRTKNARANSGIPDTPDTRQIVAVMNRSYELMAHASQTFDVSEFPSVFIDTKDYKLTDQQRDAIVSILGLEAVEPGNTGYLTAMQAQYISMGQGAKLLEKALDRAKLENRNLTSEEFQEILKANHGQAPVLGNTINSKTELTFISIDINGDKAIVRYDDGAALQEAILVKEKEHWLIASIIPVWIHF